MNTVSKKTTPLQTVTKFFRLPGQTLKDIAAEVKQLSVEERKELAEGINALEAN